LLGLIDLCVISGFRRETDQNCALTLITLRIMVISYGRFGTTYWSHLNGSRSLITSPIGCTETSIMNFHSSLRNDPEERSSD